MFKYKEKTDREMNLLKIKLEKCEKDFETDKSELDRAYKNRDLRANPLFTGKTSEEAMEFARKYSIHSETFTPDERNGANKLRDLMKNIMEMQGEIDTTPLPSLYPRLFGEAFLNLYDLLTITTKEVLDVSEHSSKGYFKEMLKNIGADDRLHELFKRYLSYDDGLFDSPNNYRYLSLNSLARTQFDSIESHRLPYNEMMARLENGKNVFLAIPQVAEIFKNELAIFEANEAEKKKNEELFKADEVTKKIKELRSKISEDNLIKENINNSKDISKQKQQHKQ